MPRLAKGELAPGIRARSQASSASADARFALMLAMKERSSLSELEATPFKSFDALCKHVDEEKGIFAISPKTFRKHIASGFDGGVQSFHELLRSLSDAGRPSDLPSLPKEVSSVVHTAAQTDAVLELSARYADLIERIAKLAVDLPRARSEFQAHLKVFPASASHLRRVK